LRQVETPSTQSCVLYISIGRKGFTKISEGGGFATRDVLTIIQNVHAEIVELNPALDPSGITARVAAKLLKEILARMLPKPVK
jgi:hypothetical protein